MNKYLMKKQIRKIGKYKKIPNIKDVKPMTFPFINTDASLREDEVKDYLTTGEVLANAKHQVDDQVKIPKVVE